MGMRREHMLRGRIWDLPEDALGPQFRIQFTRAAASGRPAAFEEHHPASGRWCEYRTYPAPDGLSVFVADVTARKRDEETLRENEERLRQYQKLEAMGKLAGGIAHDFNNILTAINGYSDLLLGREDWPDGFNRQALEEIRKAGERAAGLTRQLLAYSRKQVMTLKHLDLNEIVRDMTGILGRLLPENIRLDLRLSGEPLPIRADGTRIEQVIMNLALNARDAMPSGGILTMRTCRKPPSAGAGPLRKPGADPASAAERAARPELGWAALEVRDSGTGMDAETMSRIFEPFFTTKGQGKGTGLGLSTVFGIVDQLGGQVRVDSAPGKGAAFEVLLRISDARVDGAEAPQEKVPGRYGSGRETVLVAEDEPSVRLFVERILASRGYSVILATDGMDALRLSRECREEIHMLLTDVVMPRLGGRELSERLLAERPGLRVLFMSGHTDDALLGHGVLDGQAHFLQKPFNTGALLARIDEVLGRDEGGKPKPSPLGGEDSPGSLANSSNSATP
jgi:signal transduction histidine kinase/ActR/RegA family two-component response regulator